MTTHIYPAHVNRACETMASYFLERRYSSWAQRRTSHTVNWVVGYGRGGALHICARMLVNIYTIQGSPPPP